MSDLAFPEDLRLSGQPMTRDEAVIKTNTANTYLKRGPMLVMELKRDGAWKALGYTTWVAYVEEELVITVQYADKLVKCGENLAALSEAFDIDADLLAIPERVMRGLPAETMVSAAADAVADLPDESSDADKAAAVTEGVRSAAVEAARARREREAAEREAAAFARGQAQAAEPEQEPAPVPAPDPAPHAPQAASPAGLSDARATGSDSAPDPVAPSPVVGNSDDGTDEPGRVALPVPAVTTPPGWDWDVVFAMSPENAVRLLTEAADLGALDDAADWLHRFDLARKAFIASQEAAA